MIMHSNNIVGGLVKSKRQICRYGRESADEDFDTVLVGFPDNVEKYSP